MFFAAMLSASAVAQEKDRRTLVLLLLTHLSNSELVLGKLLASLLQVLVMLTAALPVFMLAALWGGVSFGQIARVFAVTLASVVACGSLGLTLALWREKTFQALSDDGADASPLAGGGRDRGGRRSGKQLGRHLLRGLGRGHQPMAPILAATHPYVQAQPALGLLGTPVHLFILVAAAIALVADGMAVAMVRVWNCAAKPNRAGEEEGVASPAGIWNPDPSAAEPEVAAIARESTAGELKAATVSAGQPGQKRTRQVWDNPVLWRRSALGLMDEKSS